MTRKSHTIRWSLCFAAATLVFACVLLAFLAWDFLHHTRSAKERVARIKMDLMYKPMDEFRDAAVLDVDGNGICEYGDTAALIKAARSGQIRRFWVSELSTNGPLVLCAGYLAAIHVPPSASDAERFWCAYAWPRVRGLPHHGLSGVG